MDNNTIEKRIYYYNFITYYSSEGKIVKNTDEYTIDIIENLFEQIENNNKKNKPSAIDIGAGNKLYVLLDKKTKGSIYFRLVLSRVNERPFVEENGKLEDLSNFIKANQNIAEITHCIFFRKYGIFGVEYNFSGARVSAIAEYITKKEGSIIQTRCMPKLNLNALDMLDRKKDYVLFDLSIRRDSGLYNKLLSGQSIFSLKSSSVDDVETIEIVLKKRRTKKNNNSGFDLPFEYSNVEEMLREYRDDIKKFMVSQTTANNKVDLLSDRMVAKLQIDIDKRKIINSKQMYKGIQRFFETDIRNVSDILINEE